MPHSYARRVAAESRLIGAEGIEAVLGSGEEMAQSPAQYLGTERRLRPDGPFQRYRADPAWGNSHYPGCFSLPCPRSKPDLRAPRLCRYMCPVGGFIGLYSQAAPFEVRVRDTAVCAAHTTKTCYTGSEDGYGCPWGIFPGGMVKNTYCGACLECLRTCPLDNIAINIRPAGSDLSQPRGRRLDEAFKAFIMLGSAFVYSAVMLGPWGQLKTSAYAIGSLPWLGYVAGFLAIVFVLLPGLFYLATRAGRALSPTRHNLRRNFIAYAYALVPLGLAAWIAFSLSFVFANASYILAALSDPLGWGWDLFGTATYSWTPFLTQYIPILQTLVLVVGLAWAGITARRIAQEGKQPGAWRQAIPINLFCL
ncbi:MAG TPA: hypothetical protein VLE70_20025, partial [Anaerolineae bacterium]|nr:hypothetical protein [Anaerolineae bacterium]